MPSRLRILLSSAACCLLLLAASARATDVAFWEAYRPDEDDLGRTYLLLSFDGAPVSGAAPGKVRLTPAAPPVAAQGRFGKALRLDGRSALRADVPATFDGNRVSVEAWVKLDALPEKPACVVFRPAVVDADPRYDPAKDKAKGFSLWVGPDGSLHLDTVNAFYGTTVRTSSPAGVVPAGRWVHLAGVSAAGPAAGRRLYVDGREVASGAMNWGQALEVSGDRETQPQPVYVGNNDKGTAGLAGLVDQVRVHRNVLRFWERDAAPWADPEATRPVPATRPHFVPEHAPVAVASLDGPQALSDGGVKVELGPGEFRDGVRGKGYAGRIVLSGPSIFRAEVGSLEFFLRPLGVNTASDRNRTFIGQPFIFYLFNSEVGTPTLYFDAGGGRGLHFLPAGGGLELHPGRFFHIVFTWEGEDLRFYVDGRRVARTVGQALTPGGRRSLDHFTFNPSETVGLFDEVRIYGQALEPEEVANAFWRYRDPAKMTAEVHRRPVKIFAEHFPSRREVVYELEHRGKAEAGAAGKVVLELRGAEGGKALRTWRLEGEAARSGTLTLPERLADGPHILAAAAIGADGRRLPGEDAFEFYVKRFEWEGNNLGMTDEVFAPFEPVRVRGREVSVVGRTMTMNGFGLWDRVASLGRGLLAAPMTLRYETAAGEEGKWTSTVVRAAPGATPAAASFEAEAVSPALRVRARSTVEFDGCMKVTMTLEPPPLPRPGDGAPAEVRRLFIEVPLKDAEAPLMHAIADGLRRNTSGAVPAGKGVVWDGSKAHREERWRNAFVPYVWLGSARRGLAFFAENDRGWATAKGPGAPPTHELVRDDSGRLTLRVYLINVPTRLTGPRELVFGLQASPTKPMPADWRARVQTAPGALAVVPWGGIQCASQGPVADDWSIVDKILEVRRGGGPFDRAFLDAFIARHRPPRVHNESDFAYYQHHFAQRASEAGPKRPLAVYQEEMRAAHSRPEWVVYQDEWKTTDGPAARTSHEGLDLRGGHRSFSEVSTITFPRSYVDFGCHYADQWLRRGVSLYWDNTYLYASYNTRTTAAYAAEDGLVQPALIIWAVREYHRRVWNLLQQHRRARPEPLEWTLHMTNTLVLPVHTFGTANLDHELHADKPFSPEWLLTETTGLHTGSLPLSLYAVAGSNNALVNRLPPARRERIEWGMRAVHEVHRSPGPLERLLQGFGYAARDVAEVHNYYDDRPVLSVTPGDVKWLALSRPKQGQMLIVLQSWSEKEAQAAEVRIDLEALGLDAARGLRVTDAETSQVLAPDAARPFRVPLAGPYGTRLLRVNPTR